jgi:uncharacterized protein YaaN involved in tellurite resistance
MFVIAHMYYIYLQEIMGVLRTHEELIQGNNNSIYNVTTKVQDNEQHIISQIASIMDSPVQLKKKIAILEAECGMIRNLVVNLHKYSYFGVSNKRMFVNLGHGEPKEEDMMHQLFEIWR